MSDEDIEYVCTWLRNYITLYIIHGEEEAYAMVEKLNEVLKDEDERKKYRRRIAKERNSGSSL